MLGGLDARISRATERLEPRQITALQLGTSVAFALAILAASAFLEPERSETLMFVLIATWWVPFSVLSAASSTSRRGRCDRKTG